MVEVIDGTDGDGLGGASDGGKLGWLMGLMEVGSGDCL